MSSIQKIIGPSIYRMSGKDQNVLEALKTAYRDNKKVGVDKKFNGKKSACIADDVLKIINATPDTVLTKAEEASLWLFSLYTGARAISATSLRIKDLSWREGVLQARIQVTKGG